MKKLLLLLLFAITPYSFASNIFQNNSYLNANGEKLAFQTYYTQNQSPSTHPRLLIFIHGDNVPGGPPADYLKSQAIQFTDANTVAVVLIRPGCHDSYNHYSSGQCDANYNGYPSETVATIAAAISELKNYYHPSRTILIGHSGGAIMSGIILGKYPNLADGAVLASVTNNMTELFIKHHHDSGDWSHSLSPDTWINNIPKNTYIAVVAGNNDTITYPDLAYKYYSELKNAGLNAHFFAVANGTHNSVVAENARDFNEAIKNSLS